MFNKRSTQQGFNTLSQPTPTPKPARTGIGRGTSAIGQGTQQMKSTNFAAMSQNPGSSSQSNL